MKERRLSTLPFHPKGSTPQEKMKKKRVRLRMNLARSKFIRTDSIETRSFTAKRRLNLGAPMEEENALVERTDVQVNSQESQASPTGTPSSADFEALKKQMAELQQMMQRMLSMPYATIQVQGAQPIAGLTI